MLEPWHDFYGLIGTAAATLVGLMFVAASVSAGVFSHERQDGLRTFLSPTVVAFSAVLTTSLVGVLPEMGERLPGGLLAALGLLGLGYSWRVWKRMVAGGMAGKIDAEDRAWYVIAPAAAYAVLAAAGLGIALGRTAGCGLLAAAVFLLLLAGVRNAWDMTTWVVLKRQG